MTLVDTHCCPAPSHNRSKGSILSTVNRLYDVWRQRQVLRNLDGDALEDIGLSRKEAITEARRPIWDAPATWCD